MENLTITIRETEGVNEYSFNKELPSNLNITESQRYGFFKIFKTLNVIGSETYEVQISKSGKHLQVVLENDIEFKPYFVGVCGKIEDLSC